jgi:hypothetical protein
MGIPREPKPSKLFMSLIYAEEAFFQLGLQELVLSFGETDFMSERFLFNFTDYYSKEMGPTLFRHFLAFQCLIPPSSLPEIKQTTNRIEGKYVQSQGNRRLNIDPGYLSLEHVILATTKGYVHRPYLRDGIYADLTLIYEKGSYRALEWTYPDYRQPNTIALFNRLRTRYAEALKRRIDHPC